jgi:hypothetical protein
VAIASVHAKFGGLGAAIPNAFKAFTIHDTNTLDATTVTVLVAVTAAGNLVFEDWFDNEVTLNFPAAGRYQIDGQWQRVKSTGATATLSPATTVNYGYIVSA